MAMIVRSRLFHKILLSYVVLLLAVLLILDIFMARSIHQEYVTQEQFRLETAARILSTSLPTDLSREAQSWAKRLGDLTRLRITLISSSGKVLAENQSDPSQMNDHSNRPEIRQALQNGIGQSTRYSRTLGKNLLYLAYRIQRPGETDLLLRLALPLQEVSDDFRSAQHVLFLISFFAFLLALALGYFLTGSLVGRIENIKEFSSDMAQGNLGARIREETPDELGSLARSLNKTADQMQRYITELEGEQNRMRAILESMQAGVLATDSEGRLTLINSALAKILAIDPETNLNLKVLEVVRNVELKNILDRVLNEQIQVTSTVQMMLVPPRVFEVVAVPLQEGSARPRGAVAVLHDMTKLQHLENIRKDFVANVSHELRTPLTSIRGFAETLLEGALEDKKNNRRFVEIIRSHAVQLSNLTMDLLSLAALEWSETGGLKLATLELKPLLEEVIEEMRPLATAKNQTLKVRIVDGLSPVKGDPEKLRQVFLNLLDNAIKFTPEGGCILLEALQPEAKVILEVHIKDNGPGIPST
ncbi:MAG TPA: histidine kinase dimerization/phospho-acceptor domain-containing protein, partial [Terriglobia bacterium]|nr:histidine kinase dimerization/phospho-acceptor domain-containing protein [Terriglobia bacterium]